MLEQRGFELLVPRVAEMADGQAAISRDGRVGAGRPMSAPFTVGLVVQMPFAPPRGGATLSSPGGRAEDREGRSVELRYLRPVRGKETRARRWDLTVRIHFPPADSPSLAQTRPLPVEKPAVPRGCALAARSAETRRGCRDRANRRYYLCRAIFQYRSAGDVIGQRRAATWPEAACCGSISQAKPSTVRCSCQASGRRECASSLSAVRSRGCRPSRMAWVISGAR